jgi:pyrroline-5-carboxylate reductase
MAGAMLRRWIESGVVAADAVDVVNRHDRDLPAGVRQGRDLPAGSLPDIVMLGMKPQQLDEVAARFSARLSDVPLLVSILAGVEESALAERFPGPNIVRAMPNLPVAFGKGVVALFAHDRDVAAQAEALMRPLGLVEWVDEEALFNAVTALSGSGPGFVFRFIDALAHAGAALGLPADQAARFATATMEGAAMMASLSQESAAVLADRVASPGGSTREGLNVLDRDEALVKLVDETLAAACRRNAEMAAAAR